MNKVITDRYITCETVEYATYFKMPKALDENPKYDKLSLSAKYAYAILRDRTGLSVKNKENWTDRLGRVFIKFSRENLAKALKSSVKTVIKIMKELSTHDLIQEKRMGCNKANIIYVLQVETTEKSQTYKSETVENTKTCNDDNSKHEKSTVSDMNNLHTNEPYLNYNKSKDIDLNIHSFNKDNTKAIKIKNNKSQGKKEDTKVISLDKIKSKYGVDNYIKAVASFGDKIKAKPGTPAYRKYIIKVLKDLTENKDDDDTIKQIQKLKEKNNIQEQNTTYSGQSTNRFHNFKQRTDNYTADELEAIVLENQRRKFEQLRNLK